LPAPRRRHQQARRLHARRNSNRPQLMFLRILLVLLFLAAMIGGLAYLKYQQIQGEIAMFSQPMPPSTVSAVTVEAVSWQPRLRAVGNVQAVQGVLVNNQVAGQVERILFESGDMVRVGQALVQLDTEVDAADLAGLLASLDLAETQLRRNRKLLKDRAVSQADLDEINAQVSQAKAQVQSKQALIDKKTIRAPFDGQLGIRRVNLGQFLAAGSAIAELEALDPVYVDYALPERHLAKLSVGQQVQITVTAYPDRTFDGRILAVSPAVDRETRNVQIRALFENPERLLRPGMFARVETLLPQKDKVLTLPREAVTFNTYGDSVFVIEEQSAGDADTAASGQPANDAHEAAGGQGTRLVVQRRQIRTGDVRGDQVEVLDGLSEGERVVSAGQVKLRNGDAVTVVYEPLPGAAAGSGNGSAAEMPPEAANADTDQDQPK
jgi:membrane fusion protein (multidrug efflux system)